MPYLFFRLLGGVEGVLFLFFISFQSLFLFFLSLHLISSAMSFSRVADEGGVQLFIEQDLFLRQL